MWVDPDWRGQGVASRLVDAVIEWARQRGKPRILLDVGDGNAAAIALYQSKGFEPTGKVGFLPPPRSHLSEHQRVKVL